jgi:hypothetical protein
MPGGWTIGIWLLPAIGPADAKRAFKRTVERMLDVPPPT